MCSRTAQPAVRARSVSSASRACVPYERGNTSTTWRTVHPSVRPRRGSSSSWPYTSCERRGTMPSYRTRSRAGQPSVRARGGSRASGLIPLRCEAAPGHRAGGAHARRSQQCGRKGSAVLAGPASLTSKAIPVQGAVGVHARGSLQCVRERAAVPAGRIPLTSDAAPWHRAGRGRALGSHQCVREVVAVPAASYLSRSRQHHYIVPDGLTHSAAISAWDRVLCNRQRGSKASSAGRPDSFYEGCNSCHRGAAASCRWRPRTWQPSGCAERTCGVSRPQLLGSPQRLAVVPGVISCCAAVRACGKGPRDPQASQLLRAMQRQVTVPKGTTCWAAVSACEKALLCRQAAVGLPQAGSCNAAPCLTARRVHARGGRGGSFWRGTCCLDGSPGQDGGPATPQPLTISDGGEP